MRATLTRKSVCDNTIKLMILLLLLDMAAARLSADAAFAELVHLGAVLQELAVAVGTLLVEGVIVAAGRRGAAVLKSQTCLEKPPQRCSQLTCLTHLENHLRY